MNTAKLKKIAWKYLSGTANEKEKRRLHEWYDNTCDEDENKLLIASPENRDRVKRRMYLRLQILIMR